MMIQMYSILLVEDNPSARKAVTALLTRYGYAVEAPTTFDQLMRAFEQARPDLVLLDVNLPVYDGFHFCRELRARSAVPIILLTSRDSDMDQVMGITLGADDYIVKPYVAEVLLARIAALLRRTYGRALSAETLEHRGLRLDLATGNVTYGEAVCELTKNELKLLHALLERQGQLVAREQLMERLWSSDLFIDENTLTVNIARLRAKLAEMGLDSFIETRRGLGYIVP